MLAGTSSQVWLGPAPLTPGSGQKENTHAKEWAESSVGVSESKTMHMLNAINQCKPLPSGRVFLSVMGRGPSSVSYRPMVPGLSVGTVPGLSVGTPDQVLGIFPQGNYLSHPWSLTSLYVIYRNINVQYVKGLQAILVRMRYNLWRNPDFTSNINWKRTAWMQSIHTYIQ